MQGKKIVIILLFLLLILIPVLVQASENQTKIDEKTLIEQQESFGINDFLKNSKEYTGEILEGNDITDILNSAIQGSVDNQGMAKKILGLLGTEVQMRYQKFD